METNTASTDTRTTTKWYLVKGKTEDGKRTEWQISDGPAGQRSYSADFEGDLEAALLVFLEENPSAEVVVRLEDFCDV